MNTENIHNRLWTEEEDRLLLTQVRAFPQNLSRCFIIVSEQTGRSKGAVSARWYQTLSKKPEALCFFTASSKHISPNRKNAQGLPLRRNMWQRFVSLLRNLNLC